MSTLAESGRAPAAATPARFSARPRGPLIPDCVWRAFWASRLVVAVSGVLAVLAIGNAPGWQGFDPAGLTTRGSYLGNLLAAPFARWDSVWYLAIAQGGYANNPPKTAFFPLYPLLISVFGEIVRSQILAGVLISLACFAIALVLLHRLASLELGERAADLTVMLVAFAPMSYFFSALYTESLFLALSLGCLLAARRERWAIAGILGGVAAASRNSGITLIVPVVLIYLYGPRASPAAERRAGSLRRLLPRYRPSWSLGWALLIPAGLLAYIGYLALTTGDGLAPFRVQEVWFRHFAGPFGGIVSGSIAAFDGLRQLAHGPPPPLYFRHAGGDALTVAGQNLMLFAFLLAGIIACVGTLRRLPIAYGAYAIATLAMPLSYPVTPQPLASLPRYEVVVFPLFMWGGQALARRRAPNTTPATLAVLLGLFTAEFATWRFVA